MRINVQMQTQAMTKEDDFIPTRQSLLERLRSLDDQQSWRTFFETYWKLIFRAARRAGLNNNEAEDVVQETVIHVAQHMPGFVYRSHAQGGSFKQWLLTQTKWRIADQFRKRQRRQRIVAEDVPDDFLEEVTDGTWEKLEELWLSEWEQNLADAALARLKEKIDPHHYQIFFLSVIKEWPAIKVARSLSVSIASVYAVRHRVKKLLTQCLEQLKHETL
jgi:RNA polymerase sigma-70 factor (ECF subfamily)